MGKWKRNYIQRKKITSLQKKGFWVMKNTGLFDATMGSYDGADVCILVGICMLKTISQGYSYKNFVLYRDDSLAVTKTVRSQKKEKRKNSWKLLANAI